MLVIPFDRVVHKKRLVVKKSRADEEEKHKGSLTPQKTFFPIGEILRNLVTLLAILSGPGGGGGRPGRDGHRVRLVEVLPRGPGAHLHLRPTQRSTSLIVLVTRRQSYDFLIYSYNASVVEG
jgi:hypothetical protein